MLTQSLFDRFIIRSHSLDLDHRPVPKVFTASRLGSNPKISTIQIFTLCKPKRADFMKDFHSPRIRATGPDPVGNQFI